MMVTYIRHNLWRLPWIKIKIERSTAAYVGPGGGWGQVIRLTSSRAVAQSFNFCVIISHSGRVDRMEESWTQHQLCFFCSEWQVIILYGGLIPFTWRPFEMLGSLNPNKVYYYPLIQESLFAIRMGCVRRINSPRGSC